MLDVTKKDLMQAPGFDKNNWPDFSDQKQSIVTYESTPSGDRCGAQLVTLLASYLVSV